MSEHSNNSNMPNAHNPPIPLTPAQRAAKQKKFLKVYRESGNIKYSCKVAGINRSTYRYWKEHDAAFAALLPDADEDANNTLEYAAYDRAVNGVESFVVSQGKLVYEEIPVLDKNGEQERENGTGRLVYKRGKAIVERKYSDTLLITLLKARMPEKYKDRQQHEHMGQNGGPVQVHVFLPE